MQTTVIGLENENEKLILDVDENLWEHIEFIAFYDYVVEFRMKNEITHNFFRYTIYKEMKDQRETEEYKRKIYRIEKCEYRFAQDSDKFLKWLYTEAEERDLLLF